VVSHFSGCLCLLNSSLDSFNVSQLYAILVLQNGGPDLEAYVFENPGKAGWRQACSIFWQVAKALANAEDLVSFEVSSHRKPLILLISSFQHRDLHWGQVLVKNLPVPGASKKRTEVIPLPMDHHSHGVQVTLIDLGMSRMDAKDGSLGDTVLWMPLDEEIFYGEGDYQFDVYRMMREATTEDWRAFHPLTNVMVKPNKFCMLDVDLRSEW
jgi:serine/threonine-protein kinase haspin